MTLARRPQFGPRAPKPPELGPDGRFPGQGDRRLIVPIRKSLLAGPDGQPYAVAYFAPGMEPVALLPGQSILIQLTVDPVDDFSDELAESFTRASLAESERAERLNARLDDRNNVARQLCQHWLDEEARHEEAQRVTSYTLGAAQCARDVLAALSGELTDEERESLGITSS